MDSKPAQAQIGAPRWRRRARRTAFILILLLGLLVIGVFFATRGPLARQVVLARLQAMVDGDVSIGSASLSFDGTVHVRDIRLGARSIPGPAGEVLHADSAHLALAGLWSGAIAIRDVRVENPVVRVSQDTDTGELNLTALKFRSTGGRAGALPGITATGGVIELGEHFGADYQVLRRLPVRGVLTPGQQSDSYVFEITHSGPGGEAARLTGSITDTELDIVVSEMDLAAWPNSAVPSRYRDLHRSLDLKGRIQPTRIRVPREGPLELAVRLEGVELDLPLDQTPVARGHMTGVIGVLLVSADGVTAELAGNLDGVPAQASLVAPTLDADTPFRAEVHVDRIRLNENLHRLSYLPEYVREKLATFSNPTAELELDLVLQRSTGSGEVEASGQFRLFDGVASFVDFPYEFRNMSGVFVLERDRLEFYDIIGTAESGAKLTASGWVAPLNDAAEASIKVHVTDVPLDDRLRSGFREHDRALYDALLDRESYRQLVERHLIAEPAQKRQWQRERNQLRAAIRADQVSDDDEAAAELARLDALASLHEFAMGGAGTVDISVYRYPGHESRWDTEILVHLPTVGLLTEHFPMPILAEELTLRVFNGLARVTGGTFRGLQGGTARVQAAAFLDEPDRLPQVHIQAIDVPVTPLLIHAIPGPRDEQADDTMHARALLTRLGLHGSVNCEARIGLDNEPAFAIDVTPNSMSARPGAFSMPDSFVADGLELRDISGLIAVRPGDLRMSLSAQLPGAESTGAVRLEVGAGFGDRMGQGVEVHELDLRLTDLDASTPIEQLVAVISPPAAAQIAPLRQRYQPAGLLDAHLGYRPAQDERASLSIDLTNFRRPSLALFDGRLAIDSPKGRIRIERGEHLGARFEGFAGAATYESEPLGDLRIDGTLTLTDQGAAGSTEISLTDARFESSIIDRLLAERAPALADVYRDSHPVGHFDLFSIVELSGQGEVEPVSIVISPRTLSFTRRGERLAFEEAGGQIRLDRRLGLVDQLALVSPDLEIRAHGRFSVESPEHLDIDVAFEVGAASLHARARSLLPEKLDATLEGLKIAVDGPVALEEGHLLIAHRSTGDQVDALGRVRVRRGRASVGVELDQVDASFEFAAHVHPTLQTPQFQLVLRADSMRASEIWLSDARCEIRSIDGNAIQIGPFGATAHNGRVAGSALVWSDVGDERPRFDLRILTSGVRFAPILADLALDTQAPDPEETADDSRGVVDSQFTAYGIVGGPRRGMGQVQVSEGRVLRLPLLLPLIEVSNLRLPRGEKLDLAVAQFYLRDNLVSFESLSVLSRSIELIGYGTMDLPDLALDLRINSRSVRRVPLLSPMLENVRDELLTTRVRGTLSNPDISSEQFVGTRRALSSLFGQESSEQDRLLQDIKQRAMQYRERFRLSTSAVQRVVDALPDGPTDEQP
ncbi:MAG: hypothetical protein KJZ65_06785 [Phycisphaerales bacterium]|nr:hypothetical protein [Phycisphaerales bacterium]